MRFTFLSVRRMALGLLAILAAGLQAAPPPLREQRSLNGVWPVGGEVPVYAGIAGFDAQTYERDVTVPAAWAGKRIKLEFGAVNFIAEVFVNGGLAVTNVGGWCPFVVDVTERVRAGETFRLTVKVKGPKHAPITDERGAVAWPVGGWRNRGGIADDVWLRAYGAVHVEDAFVRTSVTHGEIAVDYTVRNASADTRRVSLAAEVRRENSSEVALALAGPALDLAAGEMRVVTVVQAWPKPELYWPARPALHLLTTRVLEAGRELDRETRRFGFREIGIRGNQFTWNGVRINLYGDYQAFGDTWYLDSAKLHSREAWPATVDRIKAMNLRVLRWHHNPVPRYLLDVCDEKGLLVCSEAANYGRDYHKQTDHAAYVQNALACLAPWIRAERNHPSIYLWNATNEMTHSFTGPFPPESLRPLGDEIARHDPTRPVGYDGDTGRSNATTFQNPTPDDLLKNRIRDTALIDYHYPEVYNREPTGSIYGWAHLVFPRQPTGAGELLHTRSPKADLQETMERNTWWLGVWLRGLRATDWTNVKPACWWFTDADLASANPAVRRRTENLRNALTPIALFDKAYDDLGITPFVTGTKPGGTLPELRAGTWQERTLILYNDEFAGTDIEVEVAVHSAVAMTRHASGRTRVSVPLGERREIVCRFQVPQHVGPIAIVRRVRKDGKVRFEEGAEFVVREAVEGERTASAVTFNQP